MALGVEAVKAGRSVYFSTLADIIASLAKTEREGCLRERIRWLGRAALLIADEIGYLPVVVARPAGVLRLNAPETSFLQVTLINERLNETHAALYMLHAPL